MSPLEDRKPAMLDPERYKAIVEGARLMREARAVLLALRQEPMMAFETANNLFAVIDARVRARRGGAA